MKVVYSFNRDDNSKNDWTGNEWSTTGAYVPDAPFTNGYQFCGYYQLKSVAG